MKITSTAHLEAEDVGKLINWLRYEKDIKEREHVLKNAQARFDECERNNATALESLLSIVSEKMPLVKMTLEDTLIVIEWNNNNPIMQSDSLQEIAHR